ncbi:MAG: hypothetical protein J1E63_00980 [Muribaculaceae bacterium]|nr:hypothetical protein [Muribaculaceae bacterium]
MKKLFLSFIAALVALTAAAVDADIVVAADGSGDFTSVQEAINSVPDFRKKARTVILIRPGVYKEKIIIPPTKINLSLIGEDGAVLTYDDYASKLNRFGDEKSTSGSASFYVYAPDFIAENLTFENSAGRVGQAVAAFVAGDRAIFRRCRFLGNQDTLYTYGCPSRQYYEDCYIEGTVDFIFGKSTAVFNRCTIHSKGKGYLTAPATEQGAPFGYVFVDCDLTADPDVEGVYLSRPWRPYAQAAFIRCNMGGHILPAGWDNWGRESNEATVTYSEFDSRGDGANPAARVAYSRQLDNADAFTPALVLAGDDNWQPLEQ